MMFTVEPKLGSQKVSRSINFIIELNNLFKLN